MVSIGTRYLGLDVPSPLVASASPLSETLAGVRELEDAGAGAIVLFSLFEEQLTLEPETLHELMGIGAGGYAETLALLRQAPKSRQGPLEYLEHLRAAKSAVSVPIIASVNGAPGMSWHAYLRLLEETGADAIELNLYHVPTDPDLSSERLEQSYFDTVREASNGLSIPLSVKLHPFFTSLPNAARRFVENGARGLVLFNRFYQPDVDLDRMRARSRMGLSESVELRLPLRWVGILSNSTEAELAVTGGVHTAEDALKAIAMGARVAMVCSTLLRHGTHHLKTLNERLRIWLDAHGYVNVDALRGRLANEADTLAVVQRAQYMRTLQAVDVHG